MIFDQSIFMVPTLSHKRFYDKHALSRSCDDVTPHNATMDTFASRVRSRRKELGLTQIQLAKKAGLSQTTIADIERGRNDGSRSLLELARALQCAPEHLTKGAPIGGFTDQQHAAAILIAGMSPEKASAWLEVGRALSKGDDDTQLC